MGLRDQMLEMESVVREHRERLRDEEARECGMIPIGSWVARLVRRFPNKFIVDTGEIDPAVMDGGGAMPELEIYRPGKKSVVIRGRKSLDELVDLLARNGYGTSKRGGVSYVD